MQLERVLIVVEQRTRQDGSYPGFDIRHMEGPLRSSGIVDNVDILYYNDYTPNCDDALINYCISKKPQVVLLSLQNMALRSGGAPTPNGIWKITHQLRVPTVAFWFDIDGDGIAEILERYRHSVTLNVILGADASSHTALPLDTNYVYTGATFDERLFDIPERGRDIQIGFLGSVSRNRGQWLAGLRSLGISPYMKGGWGTEDWSSAEEYCEITSRLKIVLNFSLKYPPDQPVLFSNRGRVREALSRVAPRLRTLFLALAKNPLRARHVIAASKSAAAFLLEKPRHFAQAKVWEALWLRTFLLEENNPVTALYFEPYVDYVPFTSVKDLAEKIRYYLEHEEERDRIRMQGRATVEKYYNARLYWENLFNTIGVQSARQRDPRPGEIWNKTYFANRYLNNAPVER